MMKYKSQLALIAIVLAVLIGSTAGCVTIVKEKPAKKGKGGTPSKDGYALLRELQETLKTRLERSDVDLTSKEGEEICNLIVGTVTAATYEAKSGKK